MTGQIVEPALDKAKGSHKEAAVTVLSVFFSIAMIVGVMAMLLVMAWWILST